MNKVVYVEAFFKPVGKTRTVKVPTGQKTKGFFGGQKDVVRKEERWEQTGWSDCEIDGARLADDVSQAISELNKGGYEVVSVSDITSGQYNWEYKKGGGGHQTGGWGYGYGYGYSITEGVMIIAKK
ncbi:hypothetical protein [Pollutimonas sp. M17]|uniref:hypothetical protein n=1 Tax=Pollutimonas sp. M17 TaxID=2962065 RepID=UPI0021F4EF56|nr:hypothetical protein [Pollutimonas sp. M17]UYO92965.1 hypothetical protein OEG81_13855 [Pollutimonas sp. M17]